MEAGNKTKLLVLRDDTGVDSIFMYLSKLGYNVALGSSRGKPKDIALSLALEMPDAVIVLSDDTTAIEVVKERYNAKTPVLAVLRTCESQPIVDAYKAGADFFLTLPIHPTVVGFTVASLTKRLPSKPKNGVYRLGAFTFDSRLKALSHPEAYQLLGNKEAEVLQYLCTRLGQRVQKKPMLTEIWGEASYFTRRSCDVLICKLRKYLSLDPSVKIKTCYGEKLQLVTDDVSDLGDPESGQEGGQ